MGNPQNKEKLIAIADYKWKYFLYAAVCWTLVIAGFYTFNAKERHWQFWMAEVVMFLFGSGILYMIFNPRYSFIGRHGAKYEEWITQKHLDLLKEDGLFSYHIDGFYFQTEKESIEIKWSEISKITAHLEDELSNDDDIVIHIDLKNGKFIEFDEEVLGWTKWEEKLRLEIPTINASWISDILESKQKETILFQIPI